MSAAEDLVQHLADSGEGTIGGTSEWGLYLAREPDSPDSVVTVYDTGGGRADPDNDLYYPRVQVRVRHNSYRSATAKIKAIRDLLIDPAGGFTANGTRYVSASALSDPESIGYDDHDRARVVLNLDLIYEA